MKINPNKYYIAIENRIYSVTQEQYDKFKEMGGDWSTDDMQKFDAALDYIEHAHRAKKLYETLCLNNDVNIYWIPRESNAIADELSKKHIL